MVLYVVLALAAVTALFVLINLIKGVVRGFKKSVASLAAIIVSAVVAFIVTTTLCTPTSEFVTYLLQFTQQILGPELTELVFGVESVSNVVHHYVALILAPFMFLIFYILGSIIFGIIGRIVAKYIGRKKKLHPAANRLGGLGVGLVCGVLVSAILLTPVVGLLGVVAEAGKTTDLSTIENEEISELLTDLSEDQVLGIYFVSCGWLFDALTTTNYKGTATTLKGELVALTDIIFNIVGTFTGESFGMDQMDSLDAAIDGIDGSPLVKDAVAGFISEMATAWTNDEAFVGIPPIDAGEMLNSVIDPVVEVLATTNNETVIADLHTLTGMFKVFIKHDLFNKAASGDMLTTLGEGGVIGELMKEANKNPRMTVITDSIAQLSVRALGMTIGMPEDHDERYNSLMSEFAQVLNGSSYMSGEDRAEYVERHLSTALDKYGVHVEDEVVANITDCILSDLGSTRSLDGADISEFFIIYEVGYEASTLSYGDAFDSLSDTKPTIVVNGDGTISVGERVFENYAANDYRESAAYTMGLARVDLGDAASLYSAESMISSLVTLADIMAGIKKFSDCADPEAEIEKISGMLSEAVELFGTDFSEMNKAELFNNMGTLLDKMSDTELFGSDVTGNVLTAVVQSDAVRDELGLTNKDATSFAEKLNESTQTSDGSSYGNSTQAVSNTLEVVEKINDKNTTKEERRESTENLISNMTPENAELLGTLTTPSMMVNYGATEDSSEIVADSVSSLLNNMANFQDKATSDTEYSKEADAVNTVLILAMDTSESEDERFFATEETGEGRTGTTAAEYVDLLVGSEVVSDTLLTMVYEDGKNDNPFNVNPSEADKEELKVAIDEYYTANSENLSDEEHELLMKKLNAVAVVTNIELPFVIE